MADGFAGKVIKVDLTTKRVDVVDTDPYKAWGGGHGVGSALFWEMCEDKTIDAFDPGNVVTITPGRFSATLAPSAARTEVQGLGPQGYPTEWFTRSNFGGRWGGMLRLAGYDSVAVVGKADTPVWIDIQDGKIEIRDASETGDALWGLDTFETQKRVWDILDTEGGEWRTGQSRDAGRTLQRAAILTIGAAGESITRNAALVHDGGSGAGQGGFGGVWGSKNLKAISVIGTGSVEVADAAALMDTRLWLKREYMNDTDNPAPPIPATWAATLSARPSTGGSAFGPGRPEACMSCHKSCHGKRVISGLAPGSHCDDAWYSHSANMYAASQGEPPFGSALAGEISDRATELLQRLGLNSYMLVAMLTWLHNLHEKGLVGPGKLIETDLFETATYGTYEFAETFLNRATYRQEIGEDLAEGPARMAMKYGRYEEDTATGDLILQEWGWAHHYDARTEVEWGYGSLFTSRDCNDHDFNWVAYWMPSAYALYGVPNPVSAEKLSEIVTSKMMPYTDIDLDYSDEGIYSDSMVKLVSWHRAYSNYFKQSLGLCDWAYSDFINLGRDDLSGATPEVETRFVKSITGSDESFEEGITKGKRIGNLDRAIWVLQGRHRDQEVFTEYNYSLPAAPGFLPAEIPYILPVKVDGKWSYKDTSGRVLDRERLEDFKTRYYEFEGWDPVTGWPTKATLEELDLGFVADALGAAERLGGVS